MTEIRTNNYFDMRFTRDFTFDYSSGDICIKSIFEQYDKDRSGDFNDEEWNAYKTAMSKVGSTKDENGSLLINTNVVKHYCKKIHDISNEIDKLVEKYKNLDNNLFASLIEFEHKYSITRRGYLDESEIPEGALKYDISALEMGILNQEGGRFTGETYQTGYISGLENLSETEKQKYLQLLEQVLENAKEYRKFLAEYRELNAKCDKYHGLYDMACCGLIKTVGSADYENQEYEKYTVIKSQSNPFYHQIKILEQKREELRLKATPTEEDSRLLALYDNQISNLTRASSQWSLSKVPFIIVPDDEKSLSFTNTPLNLTMSEGNLSNTTTFGVNYSDLNFGIEGTVGLTQVFTNNYEQSENLHFSDIFSNSLTADLNATYKRGHSIITSISNLALDKDLLQYNQTFSWQHNNLNLSLNENLNKTFSENGGITSSTTANIQYTTGRFINNASVMHNEQGQTYNLSTNADFNISCGEAASLDISPTVSSSYMTSGDIYTLAPSLNARYQYNSANFNISATVDEQFSTIMQDGSKPLVNNVLTATGQLVYENTNYSLSFNDTDTPDSHSNTYGIGFGYNTKYGNFGLDYSYQVNLGKIEPQKETINTVSVKYSYNF